MQSSILFKTALFMLSILCRKICLSLVKSGPWRKRWLSVSISEPQGHIGFKASKKLCLNLCSLKWFSPTRNLVKKIIPFMLLAFDRLLLEASCLKLPLNLKKQTWIEEWIYSRCTPWHTMTISKHHPAGHVSSTYFINEKTILDKFKFKNEK